MYLVFLYALKYDAVFQKHSIYFDFDNIASGFYISSLSADATKFHEVQTHWQVQGKF